MKLVIGSIGAEVPFLTEHQVQTQLEDGGRAGRCSFLLIRDFGFRWRGESIIFKPTNRSNVVVCDRGKHKKAYGFGIWTGTM